jgi:hypothetical protein
MLPGAAALTAVSFDVSSAARGCGSIGPVPLHARAGARARARFLTLIRASPFGRA